MFNRAMIVVGVLIAGVLACNAPTQGSVEPTAVAPTSQQATAVQPTQATATPSQAAATQTTAATATPTSPSQPTAPPVTGPTKFSNTITFNDAQSIYGPSREFPEGTEEVFALWQYRDMKAGMTVRREWYLDGALWLEREEAWDFDRYGIAGTMFDISIYDRDVGLPLGHFELRLYVDGQAQFSGDAATRSFDILPQSALAITSDDGTLKAWVENKNKLVVEDAGGERVLEILDEANPNITEIAGFDWMPQGHYLVYSIMTPHPEGFPFPTFVLNIVHIDTETYYEIGLGEERLHHPMVSPDGKYIAVIRGTGYGDACGVDWSVGFVEMHTAKVERVALFALHEFALPNAGVESGSFSIDAEGLPLPGEWVNNTRLKTAVAFTCIDPAESPQGIYELDLNGKTSQKVGELPAMFAP